jgi:predicted transcriptional regulator
MNKHVVPDKPYESERVISTRLKPDTHRALRQVAASKDASVAAILKDAIALYIAHNAHA